jgi:hypothetical protein
LDYDQPEFTMALYVSGRKCVPCPCEWKTLDELRIFAFSRGCTPAQFAYTVEVMGTEPRHVANYLQRHAFVSALPLKSAQAA